MELLWLTDPHFNFLHQADFYSPVKKFGEYLMEENPDNNGIIITGDISTGPKLEVHLREFSETFTKPIYFIYGNHDIYDSSFHEVDSLVLGLTKEIPHLWHLNAGYHSFNSCIVVGINGWYDAYHGNTNSTVELNDWYCIKELIPGIKYRDLLLALIREKAQKEADCLAWMLKEACKQPQDTIIVGTHVPPYAESAWNRGEPSDRDWVPWFSSASTGAVLDIYADRYPDKDFIVLAGHSHSPGIFRRRDNMIVFTGGAVYSYPDLAGFLYPDEKKIIAFDEHNQKVELSWKR